MMIFNSYVKLPEGNLLQFAIEAMAIEILDFPIKDGGSFHSCLDVETRG